MGTFAESERPATARAGRVVMALGAIAGLTLAARRLGYNLGTNTVVRCRRGHLFATIWVPGATLKALDLGVARLQRCPVGGHWSVVTPVREADLTARQRRRARAHRDIRIP